MSKACIACGQSKPLSDFYAKASRCKPCNLLQMKECRERPESRARRKQHYQENKERIQARSTAWLQTPSGRRSRRASELKWKYGLSPENVAALISQQGGCAICHAPLTLYSGHVDHDHTCCPDKTTCGLCVRGVLCQPCNLALGGFQDDASRVRAAAQYLERGALGV